MLVTKADIVTDELIGAFERLLPQLKPTAPLPAHNEIKALVESDSSQLIVARFPDETAPIVGILTLIIYRVPTGIRARIEDVVVDELMRKKVLGRRFCVMRWKRHAKREQMVLPSRQTPGGKWLIVYIKS